VYVEVRDAWDGHFRLAVVPGERVAVHPSQTVDVSGVMGTLASGRRVVLGAVLGVYRDSRGEVVLPPVAPGMAEDGTLGRSPAPVSGVGGALAGLSLRRLEEEPEVPADGEGEPPVGSPPAVGTIAWAKTRPDGTQVTLSDVVLTRSFASLNGVSGYFYVTEKPTLPHQRTGTMGLRIAGAPPTENPQDQRRLSLQGTMATLETGERVLIPSYSRYHAGSVLRRPNIC
jgi:hypothetical protein